MGDAESTPFRGRGDYRPPMRIRGALAAVTSAALVLASATSAHADATGTAQTPRITVTYTMADARLDGSGCIDVPLTLTFTKSGSLEWNSAYIELEARYDGQTFDTDFVEFIKDSTPATGTISTTMLLCASDLPGKTSPITISGTLEDGDEQTVSFSPSTIAVVPNPSKFGKIRVTRSGQTVRLSGAVTAQTITEGTEDAEGTVLIEAKPRGASGWTTIGTSNVDILGEWKSKALNGKRLPKGTQFRVTLTGCSWCTDATATGVIR